MVVRGDVMANGDGLSVVWVEYIVVGVCAVCTHCSNRIHFLLAADLQPLRGVPLDVLNLAETELTVIDDDALCPLSYSLKYLSLMGNPLDPDNLARALSRYAPSAGGVDEQSGNFTAEHNTSEPQSSTAGQSAVPPLPLTRLSIGEMGQVDSTTPPWTS